MASSGVPATVVIPAHNEESVLARCLSTLLDGACRPQVVVVANGCSDSTAAVARSFGVDVIEIGVASKVAALNAGDERAQAMTRVYMDADVVMSNESLRRLLDALDEEGPRIAAPSILINGTSASRAVNWYFDVWIRLPYASSGRGGSGVYALNDAGRTRFDRFPELVADDAFVHSLFDDHERTVVQKCVSRVTPPQNLRELVRVRARVVSGNAQLKTVGRSQTSRVDGPTLRGRIWRLMAEGPAMWWRVGFYVMVRGAIQTVTYLRAFTGKSHVWSRDLSTRSAMSGS